MLPQVYACRNTITTLSIFVLMQCAPSPREDKKKMEEEFTRLEYDSMRNYFLNDSSFMTFLHHEEETGDTNVYAFIKLLNTPFENRAEAGVSDSDIQAIIASLSVSANALKRFSEIDSTLQKDMENSLNIDSVIRATGERRRSCPLSSFFSFIRLHYEGVLSHFHLCTQVVQDGV